MNFEVGQQIGFIPLVWMILCWVIVRSTKGVRLKGSRPYWLLSFAFAVSWVGDYLAGQYFDGSWAVAFFWVPVQLWLAYLAFFDDPVNRVFSGVFLALLAAWSMSISWPGPDIALNFLGSALVLVAAYRSKDVWLSVPVFIYFGLGSVAYFRMVLDWDVFMPPSWDHYQGCRLLAYLAFIGITAPPLIHQLRKTDHVRGSR